MEIWPEGTLSPLSVPESITQRSQNPEVFSDRAVSDVSIPTLTLFLPEKAEGRVPVVLVCPGGGYGKVVIDKEGFAIAKWLNAHGYAAAVLKYRLPRIEVAAPEVPWPLQDALRAMKLLRAHAAEWGLDEKRVGILGCSAGGHLASSVATHYEMPVPEVGDGANGQSARPDFQILLYPVISLEDESLVHAGSRAALLGGQPDAARVRLFSNDQQVTSRTPPAFIVHAKDDKGVPIGNGEVYAAALHQAGVPCEMMTLETGGHGFGLGRQGRETSTWTARCLDWLQKTLRP